MRAKANPVESATEVMNELLSRNQLAMEGLEFIVSTGYGKDQVPFANCSRSEIVCHAKGAWACRPTTRTVIDIGGQDAKATQVDENGCVVKYRYNDKCASGTGRFLEVMAKALEIELREMGELVGESTEEVNFSNQCVIFAETEVVSMVNEGVAIPDILEGLSRSLAGRVAALVRSVGTEDDVVFTGGVAKNAAVRGALARALDVDLRSPGDVDPQIMGAFGAALLAQDIRESERELQRVG
jgi:predicted CoA-substrate-specific enzyme activase